MMRRAPALLAASLLASCGSGGEEAGDNDRCGSDSTGMPDWFAFADAGDLERIIATEDNAAIRDHAASLWRGITERNGGRPRFESWPSKDETFSTAPDPPRRASVEPLAQLALMGHADGARLLGVSDGTVVSEVFYNCAMYRHIRGNGFHLPATLQRLDDNWASTPLAGREIAVFPRRSIMLKAAYQVVARDRPTILGYWAGPSESRTPATPGPTSWTARMIVRPEGVAVDAAATGLPIVPLARFHHRPMSAEEAANLRRNFNMEGVRAGDYLILVAMHIATREISTWTWQTYWWSFQRPESRWTQGLSAPFDNYAFETGYSFEIPAGARSGLPRRAYNPYLEAEFGESAFSKPGQRGIDSNCMSCHRAAAWPIGSARFIASGHIEGGDPFFFTGNTKTDYVWGIPERVPAERRRDP